MIIDVVDMNLKTLQFNRRYDTSRYRRGTQIYNRGNVQIEKVEQDLQQLSTNKIICNDLNHKNIMWDSKVRLY